jgi:hypothetical protein
MDWLTFVAAMTGHIMWPLVIIVLLILLRKHLGVLADRIEEFSFGGAKFTWKKKLEEGAKIIEHEPTPQLTPPKEQAGAADKPEARPDAVPESADKKRERIAKGIVRRREMRKQLLMSSAFGKVLSGLDEVDKLLFEIADVMGFDPASASAVMYSMVAHGNVPPSIGKLYDTLRDARNLIAHSPNLPDEKEATEYLRQTQYLVSVLGHLKQMMPSREDRERFE